MSHTPTEEQQHAIDAFHTGQNVTIEAGAGTGKTATLQFIAASAPDRRGLYVAFSKNLQREAARKFAGTGVEARTVHSLAYATHGAPMQARLNSTKRFMFWAEKAKVLGVADKFPIPNGAGGTTYLTRQTLVRLATETVDAFCFSDLPQIDHTLVPLPVTITDSLTRAELADHVAELARTYWGDVTRPDGVLPYKHGYYLKEYELSAPALGYDYILFDEAQDASPEMVSILSRQQNTQIVAVGDEEQAIFSWRGAVVSLHRFGGARTQLTQSFRFGDAIAEEANWWLDALDANLRLRGRPGADSSVWKSKRQPEAVLTRSNAGALRELLDAQALGIRVGVAGERTVAELQALAKASLELKEKGRTSHRDLDTFANWQAVVDFANGDDGGELALFVRILNDYGPHTVQEALNKVVPTEQAEQVISTAHAAKGLEWLHVRISDDFYPPKRGEDKLPSPIPREEARLAYVASTRAIRHLDPTGLDWAKSWEAGVAPRKTDTAAAA